MAVVNQVAKKVRMTHWQAVGYQILTQMYLEGRHITSSELDLLTLLALAGGEMELNHFCQRAAELHIYKNAQSARNALGKIEARGLMVKRGKSRKTLSLAPFIAVEASGNLLLDFEFLALEAA